MPDCIFEGCDQDGLHIFGVRLRRPGVLTAIWAPNTEALVCDYHASRGMRVTVQLESIEERVVETRIQSVVPRTVTRTTTITQDVNPGEQAGEDN